MFSVRAHLQLVQILSSLRERYTQTASQDLLYRMRHIPGHVQASAHVHMSRLLDQDVRDLFAELLLQDVLNMHLGTEEEIRGSCASLYIKSTDSCLYTR